MCERGSGRDITRLEWPPRSDAVRRDGEAAAAVEA